MSENKLQQLHAAEEKICKEIKTGRTILWPSIILAVGILLSYIGVGVWVLGKINFWW